MIEEWKPIKGYEGLYEVSSFGRVQSLPKVITAPKRAGGKYTVQGKILKPTLNSEHGGQGLRLFDLKGIRKHHAVGRLVYSAFVGVVPEEMFIVCSDGNPHNLLASNLKLVSLEYLCKKSTQSRMLRNGYANPNIDDIIDLKNKGLTHRAIAEKVGVPKTRVGEILKSIGYDIA